MKDLFSVGVVPGALLGVGEDLVRGLDFGEAARGILDIVDVLVWVELERFSPVRLFYPWGKIKMSVEGPSIAIAPAGTYSSLVLV
jgi:hypothetical protein